jgi:hypothetical protein
VETRQGILRLRDPWEAHAKGQGRDDLEKDGDAPAVVVARLGRPEGHEVTDPETRGEAGDEADMVHGDEVSPLGGG